MFSVSITKKLTLIQFNDDPGGSLLTSIYFKVTRVHYGSLLNSMEVNFLVMETKIIFLIRSSERINIFGLE